MVTESVNIPSVDSIVRVTIKPTDFRYAWEDMPAPKQEVYEGRVVANDKWDKPNTFNMTGDKYIRVRSINLRYVESIEYISGSGRAVPAGFRAFKVVSKSKGNTYLVGVMNGKFKCNCVGFEYRKHCKHVAEVAKRMEK